MRRVLKAGGLSDVQQTSLLRPVVAHVACDPHNHEHLGALRAGVNKVVLAKCPDLVPFVLRWADTSTPQAAAEHIGELLASWVISLLLIQSPLGFATTLRQRGRGR